MKTKLLKKEDSERKWWLVDAKGQTVGRLSSKIASILRGKTKPEFMPNVDVGDFVIVINAEKAIFSGKKEEQKIYYSHSGIPGGFKQTTPAKLRQNHPEKILQHAIKGMLPHNKLGSRQITKLKVYRGETHPHQVQKPEVLDLGRKK